MTVSSETNKKSYAGNGSTTDFSTEFIFLDDSHVLVTLVVDATGVETTQTITTDYTLTGAGTGSAGTVTMLTAPASGETLIISRNVPLTQGADYVENDPFPAETHEEALDKLTMIAQQQQEELGRSLRFPLSVDSGVSNEIPTPTSLEFLRFNSAGTAIESVALSTSGTMPGAVTYENLNANGDVGFSAGQVPAGNLTMPLSKIGVTAGDVVQVDQTVNATTRSATTTLGTSLNHTLSDTSTTITAFNGVAGVTYHCRALGAGSITHHATNLIITQTGADITTATGDTFDVEMITGTTCRIKNYQRASGEGLVQTRGHGQCRLVKSGSNLLLKRHNGGSILINNRVETIPSGGVTLAAPATTDTTYFIYAYMNAGTMTLEASTTAYTIGSSLWYEGVAVKSGDATRTLVGMARTVSSAWVDSESQRFVISYFNRVLKTAIYQFGSNRTTSSTSYVELDTSDRAEFLTWADQHVTVDGQTTASVNGTDLEWLFYVGIDGAANSGSQGRSQSWTSGKNTNVSVSTGGVLTNGYHYLSFHGAVLTTGTATYRSTYTGARAAFNG